MTPNRPVSESAVSTIEDLLALVADGMGGHVSGELASRKARDALAGALRGGHKYPPLAVAEAVQRANLEIFDHAEAHPEDRGMGTTLTLVLVDDVHTTGATLHACAQVLRSAGNLHIAAATYVRTLTTA